MSEGDLGGFTIAVTADRRREEQALLLGRQGLEVRTWPLLKTDAVDDHNLEPLTQQLSDQPPDMLLANTGYGMRSWFQAAAGWGLLERLVAALGRDVVIGARGAKALGELRKVGLDAEYRAPQETLSELVEWAVQRGVEDKTVALQLHGEPSGPAVDRLVGAGARVICVPVYTMGTGEGSVALNLMSCLVAGAIDAVTFTAAPQLEALAEAAGEHALLGDVLTSFNQGEVIAACIGQVCAAAATDIGIRRPLVPEHTRLGSLSTVLGQALQERLYLTKGASISGGNLSLEGVERTLPPRQRLLLRPLTARPGQWSDLSWANPRWPEAHGGVAAELAELAIELAPLVEVDGQNARLVPPLAQ